MQKGRDNMSITNGPRLKEVEYTRSATKKFQTQLIYTANYQTS